MASAVPSTAAPLSDRCRGRGKGRRSHLEEAGAEAFPPFPASGVGKSCPRTVGCPSGEQEAPPGSLVAPWGGCVPPGVTPAGHRAPPATPVTLQEVSPTFWAPLGSTRDLGEQPGVTWGPTLGSREVASPGPRLVYRVSKGLRGGEKDPKSPRGPPGPRPGGDSRSLSPPAACGRCDPPHLCQATMEPCPGQPQEALLTVNEQVRPPCPLKPGRGWDPSPCPGRG